MERLIDVTASITYDSNAAITNSGTVNAFHDVNDTALVPVQAEPQLPPATKRIELEVRI
jgi:iron transport multicopper oxidase